MKNRHFTHTNYKKTYVVGDHAEGKIVKCGSFAKSSYLQKEGLEYRLQEVIKSIDQSIARHQMMLEQQMFNEGRRKEDIERFLKEDIAAKEQTKHGEIIGLTPNLAVPNPMVKHD